MPKPKPGESQDQFMSRCVPMMVEEGKPDDQAVAICFSLFEKDREKGNKAIDEAIRGHKDPKPVKARQP